MEVLSVKNLRFSYKDNGFSLKCVNLSVNEGEMVLIAGPCGCGKTTFLRLLKPEIAPKGVMEGEVICKYDSSKIGYLFQKPEAGIVCQKVREELVFGAENLGLSREEIKRSLAEITAYLGIEKYIDKSTSELSGGMKRIVNLASILMMKPRIILLDEPTKGLDPVAAADFFNMLVKLNEELSVTIIVVEHNLDNYLKRADQVLYLEDGQVEFEGAGEGLCEFLKAKNKPYQASLPETVKLAGGKPCFSVLELNKRLLAEKKADILCEREKPELRNVILTSKKGFFRYEKKSPDVLKGINLELESGKVYGIIGGNGAGKSTLLSILLGYRKYYSGKIICDQKAAYLPQNVAMIFSEDNLKRDYLNLVTEAELHKTLDEYEFTREVASWLEKNPLDLSGGQMQKAGIVKMLLAGANIYLFDEPVSGLDGMEKEAFLNLIIKLREQGKTIVLVSHDLEFIEDACDEALFMFEGEVICQDSPEKIFAGNRFYTTVKGRLKSLAENE